VDGIVLIKGQQDTRAATDPKAPMSCFRHKEVALHAEAELLGRALDIQNGTSLVMQNVEKSTCSAYDCEYVALAEDLGIPLITADKQILRDFPNRATSLRDFAGGI
jgi:hypothetical protein